MLENAMVLGDYYDFEPSPDTECPHCGTGWYRDDDGDTWESDSKLSYGYPIHGGYCNACILDSSTPKRAIDWIARKSKEECKHKRMQIKSSVIPRIILGWMGGNEDALNCRGYVGTGCCSYLLGLILENPEEQEQIEETVKDIYEEEYSEYLVDVAEGRIKEEE